MPAIASDRHAGFCRLCAWNTGGCTGACAGRSPLYDDEVTPQQLERLRQVTRQLNLDSWKVVKGPAWECPRCRAINAPHVDACSCRPEGK